MPEGVFLTGALRLHSDMELYLEEGAVLQGTAEVSDYLPKIKSRFEGIEMDGLLQQCTKYDVYIIQIRIG